MISGFSGLPSSGCPVVGKGQKAPDGTKRLTVGFGHGLLPPLKQGCLTLSAASHPEVNAMACLCQWMRTNTRPQTRGPGAVAS